MIFQIVAIIISPRTGDTAPDFTAETTTGPINFHHWIGDSRAFFFSHPADYTRVCTTEMGRTVQRAKEFATRNIKQIVLPTNTRAEHVNWIEDVNGSQGTDSRYPIVANADQKIAKLYDMIHSIERETAAARSVFIIDPDKKSVSTRPVRRTSKAPLTKPARRTWQSVGCRRCTRQ